MSRLKSLLTEQKRLEALYKKIKPEIEKITAPCLVKNQTWKGKKSIHGVLIHRSTSLPGQWQLTRWDEDGFVDHTCYNTRSKTIDAALFDGYHTLDRPLFEKISRTKRFDDGNLAAAETQKWNQKRWEESKFEKITDGGTAVVGEKWLDKYESKLPLDFCTIPNPDRCGTKDLYLAGLINNPIIQQWRTNNGFI